MCMYIYTCTHTYTHVPTYWDIFMHICMYTYTHIYSFMLSSLKCNFYLPCYCCLFPNNKYALQVSYISNMPISSFSDIRNYINKYVLYKLTALWPGILGFMHLTLFVYASEQICLPTTHICSTALALWCTYWSHISTHVTKKTVKVQFTYHAIAIYASTTNMSSITTYMLHLNRLVHVQICGSISIHMYTSH